MLHCGAVCCSVLHCAVACGTEHEALEAPLMQVHAPTVLVCSSNVLQRVALCCSAFQCVAVCCSVSL